jgi:lipid II:glycine glycyltransferase (peptidoglycan interpeptide bridge formation enzyme)
MVTAIVEKESWDAVLNKIQDYDCHHTFEYHDISKEPGELAMLLVYETRNITIGLPVIKRAVPNTAFFDCTSAYGYVGPIFSTKVEQRDFLGFQKALHEFFIKEKIISVFARLNPFIEGQTNVISNLGTIETLGKIISIDLNKELQKQRSAYSKITKRYINKARKFCIIKRSVSEEDIMVFRDLYYENMSRVNAKEFYYFSREYFLNMVKTKDFETEVIYAVLEATGEIISGAIMMKKNRVIHYHLSGTLTKYMHLNPLRLILDEARIQGTTEAYDFLNLGGGLGGVEDSLFKYKSTFSKEIKEFKIWKYIVNPEVYESLSKHNNVGATGFFPSYRYQV